MIYKADVDLWFTLIYTTAYEIYRSVGPLVFKQHKPVASKILAYSFVMKYNLLKFFAAVAIRNKMIIDLKLYKPATKVIASFPMACKRAWNIC